MLSAIGSFFSKLFFVLVNTWLERRKRRAENRASLDAERRLEQQANSPLSAGYVPSEEAYKLTNQRRRPALLVAPLTGAGPVSESWPTLVRRAYRALPNGDDAGDGTGLFKKSLDRGEIHENQIRESLSQFPTVLVYGSINDHTLHLQIAAWNIVGPGRRKAGRGESDRDNFSRPLEIHFPGGGTGKDGIGAEVEIKDLEGAAADLAILCARIVECFHVARGRPPSRYVHKGHGHISEIVAHEWDEVWTSETLSALKQSYRDDGFRPLDHIYENDPAHTCLIKLQKHHKDSRAAIRSLAFHLYTVALLALLGRGHELGSHVEAVFDEADSNPEYAESVLLALKVYLEKSVEFSHKHSPLRNEIIDRVQQRHDVALHEQIRRRMDG